MFDPAVIGTLRIGLDAIDAEASDDRPRRPLPERKPTRVIVASGLRRLAAALDRPVASEAIG